MKKHSEDRPDWQEQREKIIGLGESSLRKSYYPELREKIAELEKKNEELHTAYEQLASSEEELKENYDELSRQERELRESEHRNAMLLHAIPDLMFVISRDGIYRDFSVPDSHALARPVDQIIGRHIRDTGFETGSTTAILHHIALALATKTLQQFEYELALPQGKRRYEARMVALNEDAVLGIVRDITETTRAQKALDLARNKLSLLNTVIFQDIQSTVFALSAYIQLANNKWDAAKAQSFAEKEAYLIHKIISSLNFAKNYQDMGIHPSRWQSVNQVFLYAISHLDSLKVSRSIQVDNLEIYADPLLEKAFFNLVENVFLYGQYATEITLGYAESEHGLVLTLTDNGIGIPNEEKLKIFERGYGKNTGLGLFLVREILSITGITIRETGEPGTGARFEMLVPKGAYRFPEQTA